jgi:hypothetical protein
VLDVAGLAEFQDALSQAPEQTAAAWLNQHRLSEALPEEFDLQLARFVGRAEVQGQSTLALRLETANRRQTAWIYFVRTRDFRTSQAESGQYTSDTAVRVYRGQPGGWTVVVSYTGNDWKAFVKPPQSPA